MSEQKNLTILKALQTHLLSLEGEDGTAIFREVKIFPWFFHDPENILNYTSYSNLFPSAYIIPGEERSENEGITCKAKIKLLLLTSVFLREEEALTQFTLLQRAVESLTRLPNGKLLELGGGHILLESSSPEEFPGNLVGFTAILEAFYGK